MKVQLTITDDEVAVHFVEGCGGLWGVYKGTREDVNAWMRGERSAMEARYWDVVTGGAPLERFAEDEYNAREHNQDVDTFLWVREECPLMVLATMCAEWGTPA